MYCPETSSTTRRIAARATAIASTKGGREGPVGGGLNGGGDDDDDDDGAGQERSGLAGEGGGGGARKTRARQSSEVDGGAEARPKRIRKEGGRQSIGKDGIAEGSNGRGTGAINPTRAKKPTFKGREPNKGGGVGGSAGSDPPAYDGAALAVVVFADPFFYNYKKSVANEYSGERDEFLKNKTIDQIRQEYMTKRDGCVELTRAIGVIDVPVEAYFAAALVSVEQVLAGERFIAIGEVDEVDHYLSIGAADLPTLDALFNNYQPPQGGSPEQQVKSRSMQLCMVTGSSGSGKTFFCLHYLTRFLRNADDLSVAFYLHPLQLVSDNVGSDGSSIGKEVVRLVRSTIAEDFNRRVTSKLKMHVCLIFDEAGDLSLDGLFEEPTVLQGIYAHVKRNLASNVVMVVSGTGITGSKLKSGGDAYFYRLQPWDPEDLEEILDPLAGLLHLKKSENVRTVVDAIVAHPKLRALTTNARSAYFLVEALVSLCSVYVQDFWRVQLDAWAPALVTKVVHGYIATNGIREIKAEQRVLVAASVFQALDEAEFNTTDLPRFSILTKKEKSVAIALLTYNVERKGNDKMPSLVDGENFAISVTPAIAIVLFTMAGLQVSMVPGWRAEEEVAGLHAARRLILKLLKSHVEQGASPDPLKLREDLGRIRLFVLQKQIQAPRPIKGRERDVNEGEIRVPLVPRMSVLLNGEKSSFADVIAPYMLLQAKHTSDDVVTVDIANELRKCCLLKSCKDDRVLRGLLALWRGNLMSKGKGAPKLAVVDHQASKAYPENLVKYGTPSDVVDYASIGTFETEIAWEDERLALPTFATQETVVFVLSTNAKVINAASLDLKIEQTILGDNLQLDLSKLTSHETESWENFLLEVKQGVVIEFLFTESPS